MCNRMITSKKLQDQQHEEGVNYRAECRSSESSFRVIEAVQCMARSSVLLVLMELYSCSP